MSISASSMSYFDSPPQIRWCTVSMPYFFWIAAEMPTVPGRRRTTCSSNVPSGSFVRLRLSRW